MAKIIGKAYIGIDTGTHTGVAIWGSGQFLLLEGSCACRRPTAKNMVRNRENEP